MVLIWNLSFQMEQILAMNPVVFSGVNCVCVCGEGKMKWDLEKKEADKRDDGVKT